MALPMLIGITALAVDLSWLYTRKAVAQKAADAAALAGAYKIAHNASVDADGSARYYAGLPQNGAYDDARPNETVTIYKWVDGLDLNKQTVKKPNYYKVQVSRMEPTFFAGFFGRQFRQILVTAKATALYEGEAEIPIKGTGTYGIAPGPVNLSLFGPDAWYNNGDRYSTRLLNNNVKTPNPDFIGIDADPKKVAPNDQGYNFTINLADFRAKGNKTAYLQIFDPDCYNANGGVNAVAGTSVDEMRTPGGGAGTISNATTTKYTLWVDMDGDNTFGTGPQPETAYATKSFSGADSATDMLWNDFYVGDISQLPAKATVRLQVVSTAGSSENGFDLRIDNKPVASKQIQDDDRAKVAAALKTNPNLTQAQQEALKNSANRFDSLNGSSITAQGHIPINFNQDGQVIMSLGNVPKGAAGGNMTITNFDTDVTVGSTGNTVYYKCDPPAPNQPAAGWPGEMSGNGTWKDYKIPLGSTYQGGNWTASYSAGAQDTSVWDMSFEGGVDKASGGIRLIE
ncbi:pilus assembly protein TadG-related protein [Abditibacterium utsteinense]